MPLLREALDLQLPDRSQFKAKQIYFKLIANDFSYTPRQLISLTPKLRLVACYEVSLICFVIHYQIRYMKF
jgi:hypothetical protein